MTAARCLQHAQDARGRIRGCPAAATCSPSTVLVAEPLPCRHQETVCHGCCCARLVPVVAAQHPRPAAARPGQSRCPGTAHVTSGTGLVPGRPREVAALAGKVAAGFPHLLPGELVLVALAVSLGSFLVPLRLFAGFSRLFAGFRSLAASIRCFFAVPLGLLLRREGGTGGEAAAAGALVTRLHRRSQDRGGTRAA